MLINGREIAEGILAELEGKLVGKRVCFVAQSDDPATKSFLGVKAKVAQRLGVEVSVRGSVPSEGYDGVVVQLPLPAGTDTDAVLNSIPAELDIDLLGKEAKKNFINKTTERMPPVAGALDEILKVHSVSLEGKKIVVLGKGRLVGEPVQMYFERLGHRCTVLDRSTPQEELLKHISEADILASGIGVPKFIKPEMIKEGVVLFDAGTSEDAGEMVGDADPACAARAALMTPVPGGVGPLTVAVLFRNLVLE